MHVLQIYLWQKIFCPCRCFRVSVLATDCTDASTWTLLKTVIHYFGDQANDIFNVLRCPLIVRPQVSTTIMSNIKQKVGAGIAPIDLFLRPWIRNAKESHVPAGARVWFHGVPRYKLKHMFGVGHGAAAIAVPETDKYGHRLFYSVDFDRLMTEAEVIEELKHDYLQPRSREESAFVKEIGEPFEDLEVANVLLDEKITIDTLVPARSCRDMLTTNCIAKMGILPGDVNQQLCSHTLLLMKTAHQQGNLSPETLPAIRSVALFSSLSL